MRRRRVLVSSDPAVAPWLPRLARACPEFEFHTWSGGADEESDRARVMEVLPEVILHGAASSPELALRDRCAAALAEIETVVELAAASPRRPWLLQLLPEAEPESQELQSAFASLLEHAGRVACRARGLGWSCVHPGPGEDPLPALRAELAALAVDRDADERRQCFSRHVAERRSYHVEVRTGLMEELPALLHAQRPEADVALITDAHVHRLHAGALGAGLEERGHRVHTFVLEPGEASKSTASWRMLVERLHAAHFDRRGLVVNLGGGMVCDVGGMVAATYRAGVDSVNVPTSLLAQMDAALGGEVAVHANWATDLVGAFHHPSAVYCDPALLRSLDRRQRAAGVAEALRLALSGDRELFSLLERRSSAVLAGEPQVLERLVRRAVRRKIELLDPDPDGRRQPGALDLGRAFAEALMAELSARGLRHGEALGWGVALAVEIAQGRGACSPRDAGRIGSLLERYGLPPRLPPHRLRIACAVAGDERRRQGVQSFALPVALDRVELVPELHRGEAEAALERLIERPQAQRNRAST